MNVNVFSTVASARVLSHRWILLYFSTIPVGGIKIVTFYNRSIFQVGWLTATLILCISHWSESDSVSSRVFYSAVSTARRFLFLLKDIDECVNHTCKNGGSCVDGVDNYSCSCLLGFKGDHCETGRDFPQGTRTLCQQ